VVATCSADLDINRTSMNQLMGIFHLIEYNARLLPADLLGFFVDLLDDLCSILLDLQALFLEIIVNKVFFLYL
jgi:hypothetical protein